VLKFKDFIRQNVVLKITSLNAVVISIRLVISVFVQRFLAITVGEAGIAAIGQVRNLIAMVMSTSTLGIFNGIVKFVSENQKDKKGLTQLFSTVSLFVILGSVTTGIILGFWASTLSGLVFGSSEYEYAFYGLAAVVPFVGINRVFIGVIHGLSKYKSFAKIDLLGYILSALALVIGLLCFDLKGAILAILIAPLIQLLVLFFVFGKTLGQYIAFKNIQLNFKYKNELLAFTVMSFVSTFLINYIELDIRTIIGNKINVQEAGYWTAMSNISKNYMVFSSGIFTLYVLPKFATIRTAPGFKKEVLTIYKTILPIFAVGMLLVYVFRDVVIALIYPEFNGMEPLFKWQLLGDFVRLGSLIVAHQFLAKKMVKSFVFTEFLSLGLFYLLSNILIQHYNTEGVVMAHFIRYIVYFGVVLILVKMNFNRVKIED